MHRGRIPLVFLIAAGAAYMVPPPAFAATTWHVPGDASGTCTIATPSCSTLADALAAAASGDTIQLGVGVFPESNVIVAKSIVLAGTGPADTEITPTGVGLLIAANDVLVRDLTIRNASDAIRIAATTNVDGFQVDNVHFTDNTSDGIEIGGSTTTTTTGTKVSGCLFARNRNGIRMTSRAIVAGLEVRDSTFDANTLMGIYQANDGNTSHLSGLEVRNSTFRDQADSGIFAEEMRESVVEGNDFIDNYRAITLFKNYAASGADFGDILIRDNEFTDSEISTIVIYVWGAALTAPINIDANRFSLDVTKIGFLVSPVDIRLRNTLSHAPVGVRANQIRYHGGATVHPGAWAVQVRGNGPVAIEGNTIDGGGVAGTLLPTAGIVVRAADSGFGTLASTAVITASCNRIFGFEHGASVMSGATFTPMSLPAGAVFQLYGNALADNATAGVVAGADPPAVDAMGNWWGCAQGPGGIGCSEAIGAVAVEPVLNVRPECTPCLAASECDDGEPCTQDRCTSTGSCASDAEPRPADECVVPSMAMLALGRGARSSGDRVVWKASGDGFSAGFGDPRTSTASTLCVYDSASGTASLALSLPVAPGPEWRSTPGGGFRFMSRSGTASGVRAVSLKTNRDAKVSLAVRARGASVPLPDALPVGFLSQDPAVVVQWVNDAGSCWSNELMPSGTRHNTTKLFAAGLGR